VFNVQKVISKGLPENEWLPLVAAVEAQSTHPIAKAIVQFVGESRADGVYDLQEIKGYGIRAKVQEKEVLAGNLSLLKKYDIPVDDDLAAVTDTTVFVVVNKILAGYIIIADEIKDDARQAIAQLHALNIKTIMLSGDRQAVVDQVAQYLNIATAHGDLLPEHKVEKVQEIKKGKKAAMAFVGDGINDAPVLAISDVGIAMGGLGSDAAIETADVVIQTDQPTKIISAIKIGKATNAIVWQNIALAFIVKIAVMTLGAWGIASMWGAVFADVGVALLAILNAVRIQRMKF
jgi:Cd2+/Zn2+-exporting ATPase